MSNETNHPEGAQPDFENSADSSINNNAEESVKESFDYLNAAAYVY